MGPSKRQNQYFKSHQLFSHQFLTLQWSEENVPPLLWYFTEYFNFVMHCRAVCMFRSLWCCRSQGWINRPEVIQDLEQALQCVIAHLLLMNIILPHQLWCRFQWRLGNSGKEALLCLKSRSAAFQCTIHGTYTFEGYVRFVYVFLICTAEWQLQVSWKRRD